MSNQYFKFRQFAVWQDRCAMKVGTDGVLLGAWARATTSEGGSRCRILDIGTGTGLLALMLAQRYPEAQMTAIDIDPEAVAQAQENVARSPFRDRIRIMEADVVKYDASEVFDAIVCNPPFFIDAMPSPDDQRTQARHTTTLTYEALAHSVSRLLKDGGRFSAVIPFDYRSRLESAFLVLGFSVTRRCGVKTTLRKAPKRYLIEFAKHPISESLIDEQSTSLPLINEQILESSPGVRSPWYHGLTEAFYIH